MSAPPYDNYFVDSVKPIGAAEERRYLITLNSNYASRLSYIESGDRFVLNTRFSAYDIGDKTSDGFNHMIMIRRSGDITFENFTIYGSPHLGVSA